MNVKTMLGWMTVTVLNEHFPHPDEPEKWVDEEAPELGTAGCVLNCGPCGALESLTITDRRRVEDFVRLTKFHIGGWSWWDDNADALRWDVLEAYWAGHKSCASVNGVGTGCGFDDEERP